MDFDEARRIVADAKAKGLILETVPAPKTPRAKRTRIAAAAYGPPCTKGPYPSLALNPGLVIKCRWCGHKKKHYGACDRCGKRSNTWSAKRAGVGLRMERGGA